MIYDDRTGEDLFGSGRRWVYWLDVTQPDPHSLRGSTRGNLYKVCVVFEDIDGYYPTGDPSRFQSPWYWDQATCDRQNLKHGVTKEEAVLIVASSMGARRLRGRRG